MNIKNINNNNKFTDIFSIFFISIIFTSYLIFKIKINLSSYLNFAGAKILLLTQRSVQQLTEPPLLSFYLKLHVVGMKVNFNDIVHFSNIMALQLAPLSLVMLILSIVIAAILVYLIVARYDRTWAIISTLVFTILASCLVQPDSLSTPCLTTLFILLNLYLIIKLEFKRFLGLIIAIIVWLVGFLLIGIWGILLPLLIITVYHLCGFKIYRGLLFLLIGLFLAIGCEAIFAWIITQQGGSLIPPTDTIPHFFLKLLKLSSLQYLALHNIHNINKFNNLIIIIFIIAVITFLILTAITMISIVTHHHRHLALGKSFIIFILLIFLANLGLLIYINLNVIQHHHQAYSLIPWLLLPFLAWLTGLLFSAQSFSMFINTARWIVMSMASGLLIINFFIHRAHFSLEFSVLLLLLLMLTLFLGCSFSPKNFKSRIILLFLLLMGIVWFTLIKTAPPQLSTDFLLTELLKQTTRPIAGYIIDQADFYNLNQPDVRLISNLPWRTQPVYTVLNPNQWLKFLMLSQTQKLSLAFIIKPADINNLPSTAYNTFKLLHLPITDTHFIVLLPF